MIATEGTMTFVMFLYQEIQWGDRNTVIGFNSGGPQGGFYNLPELLIDGLVLELDVLTNVGRPGVFAFRVDQEEIIPPLLSGKFA